MTTRPSERQAHAVDHGLRVALVGYGYWGPNLARCISASNRVSLAAICDHSVDRRESARVAHPASLVAADVESVLNDPNIDALVVATPPETHATLACLAMQHGKHVFIEKPFARSSLEAAAAIAATERHDRVVMVDHTYVYSPALVAIQELVVDRKLGALRSYRSSRLNCFAPSHNTTVLWDLAVHDLSIVDALMGTPPLSLAATATRNRNDQSGSSAELNLAYPDSAFAKIDVSWVAHEKSRAIVLGFERHTVVWDDLKTESRVQLFDIGNDIGNQNGSQNANHNGNGQAIEHARSRDAGIENIAVSSSEPLTIAIEHFVDCVTIGTPCRTDASSGRRIVDLLEAAERSIERHGSVVHVAAKEAAA